MSVPDTSPRLRAWSIARRQRWRTLQFNSTVGVPLFAHLHRDAHLDAAAREPLLQQRAHPRLDITEGLRHAQLQIEKPMVHGADGDRDRGALVFVRQRGEAGHGLDHEVSISDGSSSNCSS